MFAWQINPQASLNAKYRYVSPRRASQSNTLLNANVPYQLDSYRVLDLVVNYQIKKTSLFMKVRNLFDEQYQDTGFGGIDYPGRPRMIILGLQQPF